MMNNSNFISTSDKLIRDALKESFKKTYEEDPDSKIIEELGIAHGAVRIDIVVINNVIHGYELKSDIDTLDRLPGQMKIYNKVLDRVTLVVGKNHLHEAIKVVPEWWGITIAKISAPCKKVVFYNIREAEENPDQDNHAVASLLWRNEALDILEKIGEANGVRSKTRNIIYERLTEVLDKQTLMAEVREHLCTRLNWRSDLQCMLNGG